MTQAYHWSSFIAARVHLAPDIVTQIQQEQPEVAFFPSDWHHLTLGYIGELTCDVAANLDHALFQNFSQKVRTLTPECQVQILEERRVLLVLKLNDAPLVEQWKERALQIAKEFDVSFRAQANTWLPHVSLGHIKTVASWRNKNSVTTSIQLQPPRLYATEYRLGVCSYA